SWFRDYAFLPLELATRNNPSPLLRVSINMTLMMILVGLWHGASWNFVVFGLIHGLALALHKIWTTYNPLKPFKHRAVVRVGWGIVAHALTLSLLAMTFVLFRAET